MVELGWPLLAVPTDSGGVGMSFVELMLVVEELGRALCPAPFLGTVTQYLPALLSGCGDTRLQPLLEAIGAGRATGALAVASGTDWSGLRPAVRAQRNGQVWRLRGSAEYVVDGHAADDILVFAAIEDDESPGLFRVPRSGCHIASPSSLDLSRPYATVVFDETRVDQGELLCAGELASAAVQQAIDQATASLAMETVGVCQAIFDLTLRYARQRVQFGQPIASFQAVQHKFADMLVALEKARATSYYAAMAIANRHPDRRLAASMAKVAASDCAQLVVKEGIQIHGAMGYTWQYDLHLYVRRAMTNVVLFGNAREHRAAIATILLSPGEPTAN
jgi:alkylation response protein AidB-like acyl-CoA dehydrogenase